MEKLLVERVTLFTTARRHENIASDELVDNFAVGGHTAKSNIDFAFKLDGHLDESETHMDYFNMDSKGLLCITLTEVTEMENFNSK